VSDTISASTLKPVHFAWKIDDRVATITLNRPERKNPLTLESYRELTDTFLALQHVNDVRAIVITGAGGNFCSGGDVHDIIGRLVEMKQAGDEKALLEFTQMTGDLVKAMRGCPQPIVAAVDGVCVGAGAILAMASDIRYGTARSKVAFLFVRVGLSGADMGACAILPRIIGFGRASELLFLGRSMSGEEAERWGFYNKICEPEKVVPDASDLARSLAHGPTAAHAVTKECLNTEWSMSINDALDYEARMQAKCMMTEDFERAYRAFMEKKQPVFEGN
jgi:enoyl-CoA hydratase/carnithine racemase